MMLVLKIEIEISGAAGDLEGSIWKPVPA